MGLVVYILWMLLALTVPAAAQGCGAQNPNCIVPTAPPGTSNNQAASTAFVQNSLSNPSPLFQIGPLPFVTADSYSAGAANASLLAVRGSLATPITDNQAVAIFQATRNNTATNGSVPALYASTVKIGSGANIINQAAQFEAVETAGNGAVAGAYSTGACTTAGTGNCEGLIGIATATVSYSTLLGTEGNAINSSGTNQTTTFNAANFAAGFLSTCGGTNSCFAGYMTNPSTTSLDINGYYVAAASVSDTAFRNDASLVNGVDLSRGTYSGSAYKSPGFDIGGTGSATIGAVGIASGSLTFDGTTSGSFAISASGTGVPTMSTPWPVAAGGTGDTGTAWSAYTPSLACGSATFTTNSARSKTLGKTTFIEIDFTITAVGTCNSNNLTFNIPITTASAGGLAGQVANNAVGGGVLCGVAGGATAVESCKRTDNTFIVNDRIVLSGALENQ